MLNRAHDVRAIASARLRVHIQPSAAIDELRGCSVRRFRLVQMLGHPERGEHATLRHSDVDRAIRHVAAVRTIYQSLGGQIREVRFFATLIMTARFSAPGRTCLPPFRGPGLQDRHDVLFVGGKAGLDETLPCDRQRWRRALLLIGAAHEADNAIAQAVDANAICCAVVMGSPPLGLRSARLSRSRPAAYQLGFAFD